jgi:hypothetical protein
VHKAKSAGKNFPALFLIPGFPDYNLLPKARCLSYFTKFAPAFDTQNR